MRHKILFAPLLVVACAAAPAAARAELVACDLVDQQSASYLLGSSIKQHTPNRSTIAVNGGTQSNCAFFAERSNLRVSLQELRSPADAAKVYESLNRGGAATLTPEPGLGDKAAFWRMGTEGSGFIVLKGNRVLMLDAHWRDQSSSKGAKPRLRSAIQSAVPRL